MDQMQSNMPPQNAPQSGGHKAGELKPNVAAALSYVLGAITGIIFLIISKDKFVRFHAMQSIILSVGYWVVDFAIGMLIWRWYYYGWMLSTLIFILFVYLIYQAYQNIMYKLPVIGDLAEKWSAKV